LGERLAVVRSKIDDITKNEEEDKRFTQEKIERETRHRTYFEEELSLKLVLETGAKSVAQCAEEAVKQTREGDLAKGYSEIFQALHKGS
jgi:hypothetical protein